MYCIKDSLVIQNLLSHNVRSVNTGCTVIIVRFNLNVCSFITVVKYLVFQSTVSCVGNTDIGRNTATVFS